MVEHAHVVLETDAALPIGVVGWSVLVISLLVTALWLAYVYR